MKFKNIPTGKFRSRLENRVSDILTEEGVEHVYEKIVFTLLPSFIYDESKIRPITYKSDFTDPEGQRWLIEVKGMETPDFKLKWKMLKYTLQQTGNPIKLYMVKTLKELRDIIPHLGQDKKVLRKQKSVKLDTNKSLKSEALSTNKRSRYRLDSPKGGISTRLSTD